MKTLTNPTLKAPIAIAWLLLLLWAATAKTSYAQTQGLEGTWHGSLKVQPQLTLRLVIHLKSGTPWTGSLDSPDQGANGMPLSSVTVEGNQLKLEMQDLQLSYQGSLLADSVVGTFRQGMLQLPLVLHRKPIARAKKAQEPTKPYPYEVEELKIYNPDAQIHLAASLSKSTDSKRQKRRAIILITGSGPQDRDESILGHKPFLVLADALTRQGYMVLRADDRGTAQSEGNFATATTYDFLADLKAQIDYLSKREDLAPGIILLGHSEGALIAMMSAYDDKRISDIVLIGAPAVRGADLLLEQVRMIHRTQSGAEMPAERLAAYKHIFQLAADSLQTDSIAAQAIGEIFDANPANFGAEQLAEAARPELRQALVAQMLSPWMRCFLRIEPAVRSLAEGRSYRVLAIYGGKDTQVSLAQNAPRMSELLEIASSADPKAEIKIFEELNHLMQTAQTGSPAEYAQLSETFSPIAIQAIVDWLNR